MISFAFLRVWQRIKNRLAQNIWLLIRLTLGFTLLFFSITLIQSANQTSNEERYNNSSLKRLVLVKKETNYLKEQALSKEDILNLSKEFPKVNFSQLIVSDLGINSANGCRFDRVILANPSIKEALGEMTKLDSKDSDLLSASLAYLQEKSYYKEFLDRALKAGTVYLLKPSPFALNAISLKYSDEADYEGLIWVFLSDEPLPEDSPMHHLHSFAIIAAESEQETLNVAYKIQLSLAKMHPTMRSLVLNSDEKIEMSVKKAAGMGQQLFFLTGLVLSVVMIGILGNYLILCDRRRHEFAVLYSIGIPKHILVLELWLENVGLFLLAYLLCIFPAKELLRNTNFQGIALKSTSLSFFAPLAGSIIISSLMTILGVKSVISVSPTVALKGE